MVGNVLETVLPSPRFNTAVPCHCRLSYSPKRQPQSARGKGRFHIVPLSSAGTHFWHSLRTSVSCSKDNGRVSLQPPKLCCCMWKTGTERQGIKHCKDKKMIGTKIFTLKMLVSKTVYWLEKFWAAFLTDCTTMPCTKSSSPQEAVLIECFRNCFRFFTERCYVCVMQITNIFIKNMSTIPMKMTPNTKDMPSVLFLIFATRAFNFPPAIKFERNKVST